MQVRIKRILTTRKGNNGKTWVFAETDSGLISGEFIVQPSVNDCFSLSGSFSDFGGKRIFRFKSATPYVPDDSRGLLHFVIQKTAGAGDRLEEEIWQKFGENWKSIKAGDIPRFTDQVYLSFSASLSEAILKTETIKFLSALTNLGLTDHQAQEVFSFFGKECVFVVKKDPYKLMEVPGFGFLSADKIAMQNGYPEDSIERVEAAINSLAETELSGNTVFDFATLVSIIQEKFFILPEVIKKHAKTLAENKKLFVFPDKKIAKKSAYAKEEKIYDYTKHRAGESN